MTAKELLYGRFPYINHVETGVRAKKLIEASGLRQDFIARRMKLSEPTLSLMLRGDRPWNARKAELFLDAVKP